MLRSAVYPPLSRHLNTTHILTCFLRGPSSARSSSSLRNFPRCHLRNLTIFTRVEQPSVTSSQETTAQTLPLKRSPRPRQIHLPNDYRSTSNQSTLPLHLNTLAYALKEIPHGLLDSVMVCPLSSNSAEHFFTTHSRDRSPQVLTTFHLQFDTQPVSIIYSTPPLRIPKPIKLITHADGSIQSVPHTPVQPLTPQYTTKRPSLVRAATLDGRSLSEVIDAAHRASLNEQTKCRSSQSPTFSMINQRRNSDDHRSTPHRRHYPQPASPYHYYHHYSSTDNTTQVSSL